MNGDQVRGLYSESVIEQQRCRSLSLIKSRWSESIKDDYNFDDSVVCD